jgi:hypothetical protein
MLAPLLALLAVAAASPLPEGSRLLSRAETRLITWRGPSARNQLTACASGGPTGGRDGDKLSLCVPL